MRASLAIVGILSACSGAHPLYPTSGDQFSLIDPGPAASPPIPPPCTGTTDERFACFERFWQGRLDARGVAGGVVVVAPDGSVHLATHGPPGTTLTPESRFAIASSSKVVLAMTVMSLVEDQQLALDVPIEKYLPELAGAATDVGDVTLAQLLSNTSGIPPEDFQSGISCALGDDLGAHVLALRGRALQSPPGAVYQYANVGFTVVGAVIERVTATPFEQVVRAHVLEPAGMIGASYEDGPGDVVGVVAGGGPKPSRCRAMRPAGGLWVSTREMGMFVRALMPGGGVISDASLAALELARTPTGTGSDDAYGLGLGSTRYRGTSLYTHSGGMADFSSAWVTLPERGFAAAVLINTEATPARLAVHAADALLDFATRATDPAPRPRSEWQRYVGRYRDDTGPLGTFEIVLDDGELSVQWSGAIPSVGLPPNMTLFFDGKNEAEYVATPIGIAKRIR